MSRVMRPWARYRASASASRRAQHVAKRRAQRAERGRRDLSRQLSEAENRLARQTHLFNELFDLNPLPLWVVERASDRFLAINQAAIDHYGFSRDEFLAMSLGDIESRQSTLRAESPTQYKPCTRRARHVTRRGHPIDVELSTHAIQWHDVPSWMIAVSDITEAKRTQRTLELQIQAMEASHNGMFLVHGGGARGTTCYVNAAMLHFVNVDRNQVVEQPVNRLFKAFDADNTDTLITELQTEWDGERVLSAVGDDGESRWLDIQMRPAPRRPDGAEYWIGVVQNVTESRQFEDRLAYCSAHDALTDLPNRESLTEQLETEIERASHDGHELAVLFIDFDGFKQINDSGGHAAGDRYLQRMARRLSDQIRESDLLARVGDDEFVLIGGDENVDLILPQMIERIQDVFDRPIEIDGQQYSTPVNIGVACFPNHGKTADLLLRRANLSMYVAKRGGGQRVAWFSEEIERGFRLQSLIKNRLREALANREFELYYQPQIDMRSERLVGVEALLRWPDADSAYASPAVFIPVAEETGLITPIGEWVLQQACHDLAELHASGYADLVMAVNVSVVQLRQPDFETCVSRALSDNGLAPGTLQLELTESICMTDYASALTTINRLHELGVQLSIDDFGTGFSSLSYLSKLPIQRLKIDRSFISSMHDSARALELVRTLSEMAGNLGLEALAEGVETDDERQKLLDYDCWLAQGFYFSHALPLDELRRQLEAQPGPWRAAN